jgi:sugar/nucleoside kinase (ribokinase family)
MNEIDVIAPIDYLVIGHITLDLTADGKQLGGTATYAGLTAQALGLRVGIVTSFDSEIPLTSLDGITVISFPTERSTTFENLYINRKRVQYLRHQAPSLDYYQIPETWRNPSIVHLGPVAQEVEPNLVRNFPTSLVGVTPQGWLRNWNDDGKVFLAEWPEAAFVLERAGAAVISIDDLEGDEKRIDELALSCRVLAVTESDQGARVYWNGDVRRFRTPDVEEVDPTGAGDIFAAAFFSRLLTTRDPWEAARFATVLSAISVTRSGLAGIPTSDEINNCLVEVF